MGQVTESKTTMASRKGQEILHSAKDAGGRPISLGINWLKGDNSSPITDLLIIFEKLKGLFNRK